MLAVLDDKDVLPCSFSHMANPSKSGASSTHGGASTKMSQ
jgi:hypothetical protein